MFLLQGLWNSGYLVTMKPPGNDRLNILGDKTAEFYLNPKSFVEGRVAKHKSSVFQQRFLNKQTIWLTDYNMVNRDDQLSSIYQVYIGWLKFRNFK